MTLLPQATHSIAVGAMCRNKPLRGQGPSLFEEKGKRKRCQLAVNASQRPAVMQLIRHYYASNKVHTEVSENMNDILPLQGLVSRLER